MKIINREQTKYGKVHFFVCLILLLGINQVMASPTLFEIRVFCDEIPVIKSQLENWDAKYLSQYSFTDYIYYPISKEELPNYDHEFVRLRHYNETHWDQKNVEVVHKVKADRDSKSPDFPKHQFDHIEDARSFLKDHYKLDIFFHRQGWEYRLNTIRIYLEMIQSLPPTIEVIAPSEAEIAELFNKLHITEPVGHSVPQLVKIHGSVKK